MNDHEEALLNPLPPIRIYCSVSTYGRGPIHSIGVELRMLRQSIVDSGGMVLQMGLVQQPGFTSRMWTIKRFTVGIVPKMFALEVPFQAVRVAKRFRAALVKELGVAETEYALCRQALDGKGTRIVGLNGRADPILHLVVRAVLVRSSGAVDFAISDVLTLTQRGHGRDRRRSTLAFIFRFRRGKGEKGGDHPTSLQTQLALGL